MNPLNHKNDSTTQRLPRVYEGTGRYGDDVEFPEIRLPIKKGNKFKIAKADICEELLLNSKTFYKDINAFCRFDKEFARKYENHRYRDVMPIDLTVQFIRHLSEGVKIIVFKEIEHAKKMVT